MADMKTIKGRIQEVIRPNGVGAITAAEHQALLLEMVDTIETEIGDSKSEVRKDGNYPSMTVGKADNLVGRGESTLSEYSFRASGGKSIEDGTARIKTLHGNAVVWNQMVRNISQDDVSINANGVTIKDNRDGTFTIHTSSEGASADTTLILAEKRHVLTNHKVLMIGCPNGGDMSTYYFGDRYYGWIERGNGFIATTSLNELSQPAIIVKKGAIISNPIVFQPRYYDLTKMFGAGNEPNTIEEFYSRIPVGVDLNAYNEGEVIPFTADSIKSIGDNAWDEEWEMGDISGSNGIEMESTSAWRNKGYIRIIPNETYYVQSSIKVFLRARFYDRDKNFIGIVSADNKDIYTNEAFKAASNAHYIRFAPNKSVIAENLLLCISLVHSGYKKGQYFPYEYDIRKIDKRIREAFPGGMKAVLGAYDSAYNKNAKGYTEHRIGVKRMKDLTWTSPNSNLMALGIFNASIGDMRILASGEVEATYRRSGVLSKYTISSEASFGDTMTDKSMWRQGSPYGIVVRDSAYTSVEAFVASLKDEDVVYYELAEPTIIEYDEPFNLDYLVWDFGTEEIISEQPSAPLKADIVYQFNAVDEIRELRQMIATMQAQIANIGG